MIKGKSMKLHLQTLKALNKYLSDKKNVRYELNSVLVEITEDQTFYVATDLHKMCVFKHETYSSDDIQTGEYVINTDAINVFSKSKSHIVEFTVSDVINFTLSEGSLQTTYKSSDYKYPNWRQVLHQVKNLSGKTSNLQPESLKSVFDCYRMSAGLKKDSLCLALRQNGSDACLVTASDDPNFVGIVMPYRTGDESKHTFDFDSWIPNQPIKKAA